MIEHDDDPEAPTEPWTDYTFTPEELALLGDGVQEEVLDL